MYLCQYKKGVERRTPKRDEGGFHAVFSMVLFLNSLRKVVGTERVGI